MRQHPISPVTEPTQYRAIGVVRGCFEPVDPDQPTRGMIRTADGSELEAVVLGRLLTLMRRHLDLALPHLWVVYPRYREEGKLHLQMVGVWEPSTLTPAEHAAASAPATARPSPAPAEPSSAVAPPDATATSDPAATVAAAPAVTAKASDGANASVALSAAARAESGDTLPEGDDYFSVRGELIFTRPETGDLVVKIRQQPRPDGTRPTPFKLQLRGEVPLQHLRHFVAIDARRQGQQLCLEHLEVLEPINQRGNRGGKSRRDVERRGRAGAGSGAAAGGASAVVRRPAGAGSNAGRDHGRPISRSPR